MTISTHMDHIYTYSVTYTRHTHTTLSESRTGIGRREFPRKAQQSHRTQGKEFPKNSLIAKSRKGRLVNKECPKDRLRVN